MILRLVRKELQKMDKLGVMEKSSLRLVRHSRLYFDPFDARKWKDLRKILHSRARTLDYIVERYPEMVEKFRLRRMRAYLTAFGVRFKAWLEPEQMMEEYLR